MDVHQLILKIAWKKVFPNKDNRARTYLSQSRSPTHPGNKDSLESPANA